MSNSNFWRLGAPFLAILVGGSFGLKYFTQLRYTYAKNKEFSEKDSEKLGLKKGGISLEEEYARMQQTDIDGWSNIRGPRPWEDSKTIQDAQRVKQ